MNRILSKVLSILILSLTTQFCYADASRSSKLITLIEDYEFKMESSEKFTKEQADAFQAQVKAVVGESSTAEKEEALTSLISKMPDEGQREILLKKMKFSTADEISQMLVDPNILASSLQGEGANFSFGNQEFDPFFTLLGAIMVGALVYIIVYNIKYETWKSYSYEKELPWENSSCNVSSFNFSSSEKAAMKADAENKCLSGAKDPSTCKSVGFVANDDKDYWSDGSYYGGTCTVYYTYRSDR